MSWKAVSVFSLFLVVLSVVLGIALYPVVCGTPSQVVQVDADTTWTPLEPVVITAPAELVLPELPVSSEGYWRRRADSLEALLVAAQAQVDTVLIPAPRPDTPITPAARVATARLDTTLGDHGHLSVAYQFPPVNLFDVRFDPAPRPVITETRLLMPKTPWYKTQRAGFLGGAVGVAILFCLVK